MTNVVKHGDFDVGVLEFEAPTFKNKNAQPILLPTFNGERCPLIQLPMIDLDMYGVPSKSDYYKDDNQRAFLKLPLNQNNPEIADLTKWFSKIDAKFGTAKAKEKIFQKKGAKHTYQPIVRVTQTEDGKPNVEKHPYIKLKLMMHYPSGDITTAVIKKTHDGDKNIVSSIPCIDEFAYHVRFKSKVKCLIVPSKLWMTPNMTNDAMYGISFKLVKVLVEPPPERVQNSIEFIASDNEDED
jgi:hypothetical protein